MAELPLRHRQILYYLQHRTGYTTGQMLADHLHTSTRTIRNDVADINRALEGSGVQIVSKHRFGYVLSAEDPSQLASLTRSSGSFLSRTERLRHVAFCLCLRDGFQNLDELADEMFISKTTLELDLKEFRREYLLIRPHIELIRHRNSIAFENNERKKRHLLCHLFASNWNYNGRGNTFYQYHYLDEKIVNLCMREINYHLDLYGIQMEDVNVVYLDLMVAIMIHRLRDGYALEAAAADVFTVPAAVRMVDALANTLEEKLDCRISETERREIYELVSCSILPDMNALRKRSLKEIFSEPLLDFAGRYLRLLETEYGLSFCKDQDFLITLLLYLQYLDRPVHNLNRFGIADRTLRVDYAVEFELAFRIQPLAVDHYGSYLDYLELFYLMNILSGALHKVETKKVRAVIMSYYNMPAVWNLRRLLDEEFGDRIIVKDLLPMYLKDNYDFSDTDLVLTSANKQIVTDQDLTVLRISPYFTGEDKQRISGYLNQLLFRRLYRKDFPSVTELLSRASWEEKADSDDYLSLLEHMGRRMIQQGYVDDNFLIQILNRESLATFASHPVYIIVHSSVPAKQTHIHVTTLDHRLIVNGNKIRMVIMLCMQESERGLLFKLYNELYGSDFNPNDCRFMKTRNEFLNFFSDNCVK